MTQPIIHPSHSLAEAAEADHFKSAAATPVVFAMHFAHCSTYFLKRVLHDVVNQFYPDLSMQQTRNSSKLSRVSKHHFYSGQQLNG
jgi:hypothetical protein